MSELLHYEDFPEGRVIQFGTYHLSREEVIEYAKAWDPQAMHVDEEAAKNSVAGGLTASGWQSSAILIRLAVDAMANKSAAMASNSMEEAKWLKPVYVGDTIDYKSEVAELRVSNSRPGFGLMTILTTGINQHGVPVISFASTTFVERRPEKP